MSSAMFRAMFLNLVNDRGALAITFLLPLVFFLVLAEIFSSADGAQLQLDVAFADEVGDDNSIRLISALQAGDAVKPVSDRLLTRDEVIALVRAGTADVGLVVRADARALDDIGGFGSPPLLLVSDPARTVALSMLAGQVQRAWFEALPDVALGSVVNLIGDQYVELTPDQQAELDEGLAEMRADALAGREGGWSFGAMMAREDVAGQSAATNHVAYYAGAVAFLFLLLASMQGALTLAEERESGILDRVMASPGGMVVLVNGKFAFLVAQGFVQMAVIFCTAWLVYGVAWPAHLGLWLVITVVACGAAAGLSLLMAAACRTRMQAQNLSTIFILIMSVVGGSMVPRFFMPEWVQELGWLTPNTWVLEAYSAVFWRGEGLLSIALPCGLLACMAGVTLIAAQWVAARRARI